MRLILPSNKIGRLVPLASMVHQDPRRPPPQRMRVHRSISLLGPTSRPIPLPRPKRLRLGHRILRQSLRHRPNRCIHKLHPRRRLHGIPRPLQHATRTKRDGRRRRLSHPRPEPDGV
ncbi:hypothetical protein CaCOL14_004500 [Colletotrichum acutatum]